MLRVKRFLIWCFAMFLFQQVENVTQAVSMAHVGHLVLKTVRLVSTVLLIVSLFTANKSKVKQICAHNPPIFHLKSTVMHGDDRASESKEEQIHSWVWTLHSTSAALISSDKAELCPAVL